MAIAMAQPLQETTQNDDTAAEELEEEIEALRGQVIALKSRRSIQISTILSSRSTQALLSRRLPFPNSIPTDTTTTTTTVTTTQPNDPSPLLIQQSTAQTNLTTTNLYRALSTLTTFRVRDPDPNASSKGSILGLRIEAFSTSTSSAKFVRPYYLFLNRPYNSSSALRIHRHTIPPCIPVAALAAKHLPAPFPQPDVAGTTNNQPTRKPRPQDLPRFARALRHEIASYHNRLSAIVALRKQFHLDTKRSVKGKARERETVMQDISAADAEARQIRLEWVDGRIGRAVMDDKGKVVKCVVIGESGRDREMERRVLDEGGRVEEAGARIMAGG